MGTVMGTHSQPSCLGVYDPYVQVSESIRFHAFGAQWCTPILYEIIKYVNVLAFSKSFFSGVYVKLRGVCTNLLEKRGLYNLPYFRNGVPLSLMLIFQNGNWPSSYNYVVVSNIFNLRSRLHPDPWGNDPIWRAYFFKWVETNHQLEKLPEVSVETLGFWDDFVGSIFRTQRSEPAKNPIFCETVWWGLWCLRTCFFFFWGGVAFRHCGAVFLGRYIYNIL